MPAATKLKLRKEIIARRESGEQFSRIAGELEMSYATVRNVWHHYRKTGLLSPNYGACAHREIRKDKRIYERAIAYKQEYPSWGAGLIWVELVEEFAEADLPSERTLQRWFHRAGWVSKKPKDKLRDAKVQRGLQAHEVWAMDAKEQMHLLDARDASWLTIADEGSGAILEGIVFPPQTLDKG